MYGNTSVVCVDMTVVVSLGSVAAVEYIKKENSTNKSHMIICPEGWVKLKYRTGQDSLTVTYCQDTENYKQHGFKS